MATRIVESHRFRGGEVSIDIELETDGEAACALALEAINQLRDRVLRRLGGDPGVVMLGGFKVGDRVRCREIIGGLNGRHGTVVDFDTEHPESAVVVEFDLGKLAVHPSSLTKL